VLLDSLFDSLDFVKLFLDEKDAEMSRLAVLVQDLGVPQLHTTSSGFVLLFRPLRTRGALT
jgi:hypothetical protein